MYDNDDDSGTMMMMRMIMKMMMINLTFLKEVELCTVYATFVIICLYAPSLSPSKSLS